MYGWKRSEAQALLLKECGAEIPSEFQGMAINTSGPIYIWTEKKDLALLVHEIIHACGYVLKNVGVKADYDNDEPMAYLAGWIMKRVLE